MREAWRELMFADKVGALRALDHEVPTIDLGSENRASTVEVEGWLLHDEKPPPT